MTSPTFSKGTKCIDNSIPEKPVIPGPRFYHIDKSYEFKFFSNDDGHDQLYYWISWGDDSVDGLTGPYESGEFITVQHTFYESGKCIIQAKDLFNPTVGNAVVIISVNIKIPIIFFFINFYLPLLKL